MVVNYKGHTITRCGLSWYIDRPAGGLGGVWCSTLADAKRRIREGGAG